MVGYMLYGRVGTHLGTASLPTSPRLYAMSASFHLLTQRHHLHPGLRMLRRSFPRSALKARNCGVTCAARVCDPPSSAEVLQ